MSRVLRLSRRNNRPFQRRVFLVVCLHNCIGMLTRHMPYSWQRVANNKFRILKFIMAALCNRAGHYIFARWFLLSSIFFISSPNLSRRRLDVYHTSTHGVALARILDVGLKRAARCSLKVQDAKDLQKFTIWAPSHNFVGLYLRNWGTYRQSQKNC